MAKIKFDMEMEEEIFKKAEKAFFRQGANVIFAVFVFLEKTAEKEKIPFQLSN